MRWAPAATRARERVDLNAGLSKPALILLVVVVILTVKKLTELTRSAGKTTRILMSEKRGLKNDHEDQDSTYRP